MITPKKLLIAKATAELRLALIKLYRLKMIQEEKEKEAKNAPILHSKGR